MKHINTTTRLARLALSTAIIAALTACGGSGGIDSGAVTSNDTVASKLAALGIDTSQTPREDTDGDALPETYAPLGSVQSVNRFSEIMLFGIDAEDSNVATSGNRMTITNLAPASNNRYNWETLHDEPDASASWFHSQFTNQYNNEVRAVIDGDFDNDGIDEVAIAYQLDNDDVKLVLMQDAGEGYSISMEQVIDTNTWNNLFLTSGDYDGDGDYDAIIGMTSPTGDARLLMLANDNGTLTLNGKRIDIAAGSGNINHLAIDSGNMDYDNAIELAVVANEGNDHRYYLFDDATTGFAELKSGKIVADNGGGTSQALVGDVSLGDVDGDSIDEVVLAGTDRVGSDTQSNNTPYNYVVQVLDDADRNFEQFTDGFTDSRVSSIRQGSGDSHSLSYVHVVTADLDGDGASEIVTNQFVYNSMRTSPIALTAYHDDITDTDVSIPLEYLVKLDGTSGSFAYNWNTADFAVGDVTSDGRDNLVVYTQRDWTAGHRQGLEAWGLDQIDGWKIMASYETNQESASTPVKPTIILPDLELDDGSAALKFSAGSHQLLFTEPVIIAALAAAPCATDLGQDLGESCRTAFGSAVSNTTAITDGWNITTGAHVGYEGEVSVFGVTAGVEVMADVTEKVRRWKTDTYSTKKTVIRETGALEDSVILSVLPMDVYNYTVLSHPDANLVGGVVQVRMPREIITTMVTLDYYNSRIAAPEKRLPEFVFQHTAGDPMSYPSAAQKDGLLASNTGLESSEFTTGVGLGQTIASITNFTSTSTGREYELQANLTVLATAGVDNAFAEGEILGGFSIGGGINSAFEVTRGSENIYQGAVGNISAAAFDAGNSYNWGLFSYIFDDATYHQPFEVVNYWVE